MAARYLIRFDDLYATMNWSVWEAIEAVLDAADVRPILAVIPDNAYPQLPTFAERPFWPAVRAWQEKGWAIALHGCHHSILSRDSGIIGLNQRSEFAGVPRDRQAALLDEGLRIFAENGVHADLWVAPFHSFDRTTLELLRDRGIDGVSDGFAVLPHRDGHGTFWVPQQLWRYRWRPFGIWTICLHHNQWSEADVAAFAETIRRIRPMLTDFHAVRAEYGDRRGGVWNTLSAAAVRTELALRRRAGPVKRWLGSAGAKPGT